MTWGFAIERLLISAGYDLEPLAPRRNLPGAPSPPRLCEESEMKPQSPKKRSHMGGAIFQGVLLIVLLLLAFCDISFAQPLQIGAALDRLGHPHQPNYGRDCELNRDYWKGYISDTRAILTSPSRWGRSEWIELALVLGTMVVLYTYDQDIRDWSQRNRDNVSDALASLTMPFGDRRYMLPAVSVLYVYGHFFEHQKVKRVSLLILESGIISDAFTGIIKITAHRHRPSSGGPPDAWDGPGFSSHHLSFPSGHASFAFAVAAVIASEYRENVLIPPLVYGIATSTALSRINDDDHWASDVFFGSAMGHYIAKAIVGLHSDKPKRNAAVLPVIDGKRAAMLFSYQF